MEEEFDADAQSPVDEYIDEYTDEYADAYEEGYDGVYEGEEEVQEEGRNGKRVVTARVETVNGREVSNTAIVEIVESQPKTEVVLVYMIQSTSLGTVLHTEQGLPK